MNSEENLATINIFDSYNDLEKTAGAKRYFDGQGTMVPSHYVTYSDKHKGWRGSSMGHGHEKVTRDDFATAHEERMDNIAKYIAKYNERHSFVDVDTLRSTSIWLDSNHRCINGYHGSNDNTKNHLVHLKDENPNWYAGIELEVTFDVDSDDIFCGDRYDEDGCYDPYGDYDYDGNYIPDCYNSDFDLDEIAREVLRRGKGLFVIERDGSLAEGISFELISVALSKRAWHCQQVGYILNDVTGYLKEMGANIEQPKENGFHIHISRKFFERNTDRNTDAIQRDLNWVFQRYQEEIETIGGRKYNCWCRSAKMDIANNLYNNFGIQVSKAYLTKDRLNLPYNDHSKAFIGSNSGYTYEARVFHSTLDVERILACIEFMSNISHGARDGQLSGKTFGQIARYKNAPNLANLIKKIKYEYKQKLSLGKRNIDRIEISDVLSR